METVQKKNKLKIASERTLFFNLIKVMKKSIFVGHFEVDEFISYVGVSNVFDVGTVGLFR